MSENLPTNLPLETNKIFVSNKISEKQNVIKNNNKNKNNENNEQNNKLNNEIQQCESKCSVLSKSDKKLISEKSNVMQNCLPVKVSGLAGDKPTNGPTMLPSAPNYENLGARPKVKIKDQIRPVVNKKSKLLTCHDSLSNCDHRNDGFSCEISGLQPENKPLGDITVQPSTVPRDTEVSGEIRPKIGQLIGFLSEKRKLQSPALTPLSKSMKNPIKINKNSPARSRIQRGTVATLKSKFEGENCSDSKLESSTSVGKVIGLKKPFLEQQKSAKKRPKLSVRNRLKSAKFELDQTRQPSIKDYMGARVPKEKVSRVQTDDIDPNCHDD